MLDLKYKIHHDRGVVIYVPSRRMQLDEQDITDLIEELISIRSNMTEYRAAKFNPKENIIR